MKGLNGTVLAFMISLSSGTTDSMISLSSGTTDSIDVRNFGAKGDGHVDDTKSIMAAFAAARQKGTADAQAEVLFPGGGVFLTRPFNVSSYTTVRVEGTIRGMTGNFSGAASSDSVLSSWPQLPPLPTYGSDRDVGARTRYQALMFAHGATNVRIVGSGTIDGGGPWWWGMHQNRSLHVGRPHLVELYNVTRAEVADVTLRDSPFWTLHPYGCCGVHVHNVTIRAHQYAPNCDGIDPDSSQDVLIEDNDISVGDDHIAIKAGLNELARTSYPRFVSRNITVRRNRLRVGMGISLGSESSGGIERVLVADNVIADPDPGWSIGLHIKTALARGGVLQDVMFFNNTVANTTGFINLQTNYQGGDRPPSGYAATRVRNISFVGNRYVSNTHKSHGGWTCSVNDTCSAITVVNNTMLGGGGWSCHFVDSYVVSGNEPAGLEQCMEQSMPRATIPGIDIG